MNQKLTRRQFTQLAIAATAMLAIAVRPKQSLAQPGQLLYGVRIGASGIVIESLDLTTMTLEPRSDLTSGIALQPSEQVIDLTALADGTLLLALSSSRTSNAGNYPTRLLFLGTPKTLSISGLNSRSKLESVCGMADGSLLGLVTSNYGRPPFKLAAIDLQTGQLNIIAQVISPGDLRLTNLTQCPDGKLLATALGSEGQTHLANIDSQVKLTSIAQLSYNGNIWDNGLRGLACSAASQTFALGAPGRYDTTQSLFIPDPVTGAMNRVREFDFSKMAFGPSR